VHLDTVSRQIFGDIQETQFSGSKMKAHVHLTKAFPGGIGNRRIMFGTIFGLPPIHRTARSVEGETRNAELNGNRNPEWWGKQQ